MATEELITARMVELKRPNTETETSSVSDNARPRKRNCLDRENVALTRKKSIRNMKRTSVGKPRSLRARKTYCHRQKTDSSSPSHSASRDVDYYDQIPPSTVPGSSRVRKTHRHRQKSESSSPGHSADPYVDYDQIPPSTAHLRYLTASGRKSPATEIVVVTVPIPRALRAKSALEPRTAGDPDVLSVSLPGAESHIMPVHTAPSAIAQICSPKRELTEREFDKDMRKTDEFSCDTTLQHSTPLPEQQQPQPNTATRPVSTGSASVSPLPQGSFRRSTPGCVSPGIAPCDNSPSTADRNNNSARGGSDPFAGLDSIDGPTIVVEQPSVQQKKNADTTFSLIPETIDLTSDTPSPIHSPRSGPPCLGKLPFSHHVSTSSPVVSKDGASENTGSSVLDLTDTKYRDFDVSLDSSFCLPSSRTSVLKRSPTLPPPRTKHKKVTFALSPEEVDEEQLETLVAPVEAIAPATRNETDELELEFLELEFEPPRGDGSSPSLAPSVDSFPCLGPRLTTKPQAILPSPTFYSRVGKAAGPSSLHSSSVSLRRNRSRLSKATLLSRAAHPKHRRSVRDASLSPAQVELTARGNYVAPIMAILDEIHAIVKSNVQSRFDSLISDVAKLRKKILAQTQADMSALLDDYITAFNSLVNLDAKYAAFSSQLLAVPGMPIRRVQPPCARSSSRTTAQRRTVL